jgi:spore coat polysaccharide biosynthesis predicted glycosyltransferase SpsG/CMP-N-acetylneuraminic acid synthetase
MSVFDDAVVFIPAFTKPARFKGILFKKLAGVDLIQRSIDKANLLGIPESNIHLLTESEEIALFAQRAKIGVLVDAKLNWTTAHRNHCFQQYVLQAERNSRISILLSPYAPLLIPQTIIRAAEAFQKSDYQILKPVQTEKRRPLGNTGHTLDSSVFRQEEDIYKIEARAFMLLKPRVLLGNIDDEVSIQLWDVSDDEKEINSLQDWWVCEKLLQRKRIVFRVVGNREIGMGHIYRALTLAHECSDHEVLFVTDTRNRVAAETILKHDYWLGVYSPEEVVGRIIDLQVDMVINDVLDTTKADICTLRKSGAVVISFEDLGSGAQCTDLTINELYDEPQFEGNHVLWGHKYFFLRDEFQTARPHRFKQRVEAVMLAFGGTDQHDLSRKIVHQIRAFCKHHKIYIYVVTGPGYQGYGGLLKELEMDDGVSLTHSSGVISSIMEKVQLAITSNGRTVYEFAHMNIPSIVIAQHEREITHNFAKEENGFVSLGAYQEGKTEKQVLFALDRLFRDNNYRHLLFDRMKTYRFGKNKRRVVNKILRLLE